MIKVDFLVIGKTKEKWIQQGIDKYLKRLKAYAQVSIHELPDIEKSKRKESKLLQQLNTRDVLVLLDEKGKEFTSIEGAKWLDKVLMNCSGRLVFAIGSAYGFTDEEYQRANHLMSLSKMTFTHEMVRVFFLEQLYRLLSIQKGSPYHHV